MNTRKVRKYVSPRRNAQAEETRQLILAAVGRLFETAPEDALSFDAIAAEAGVQRRTIFRHFPNKDALLEAFWTWINQQVALQTWPRTKEDLVTMPPVTFAGFDQHEGVIRAALMSKSGREMRLRANPERQAAFHESLAEITSELDPLLARNLLAVVQALYSASAWQSMRDYWHLSGREAGEAVAWAIETLLASLAEDRRNKPSTLRSRPKGGDA